MVGKMIKGSHTVEKKEEEGLRTAGMKEEEEGEKKRETSERKKEETEK